MAESTFKILARGRVQGVFFRDFARQQAEHYGLSGFARNLSDGHTVEIIAQGPETGLLNFIEKIKQGPPRASVESVHTEKIEKGPIYRDFRVR